MPIYPTKTVDYNFDNPACYPGSGTTVTDLQGNLNLNFVGTPTFTSSVSNGSYFSFTAATVVANHLASAFDSTFNGSFDFSMSYCIRPKTNPAINVNYGGLNSSNLNSQNTARIQQLGGPNVWYSAVGYEAENITPTPVVANQWYVVTFTSDYTNNQLKTYINGTLVKTDAFTGPYTFINPQVILGYVNASPYLNISLADSDIKAFSIWKNVVLTGPQVQDVADEFLQYTLDKYVSLDFGDPACFTNGGTAVNDISGNNRNFTLNNTSYTYDASVGAIYMPATTQASGTPSDFILNNTATTYVAWVKLQSTSNIPLSYFGSGGGGGSRVAITLVPDGTNNFCNIDNSGAAEVAKPIVFDDDWHLVSVSKISNGTVGQQICHVDGVLIPHWVDFNPSAIVNISSPDTARLNESGGVMTIATFRIFPSALTSGDLTIIYNNEKDRFTPPPVLTLELDATNASSYPGTGSTWFDLTANNNDLTLYGNTTWTNIDGVKSFDFDGTNSYAYNASVSIGATNNFTIDSWFKINSTKSIQFISCLGQAAANTFPLFAYNNPAVSTGLFAEMGGGTGFTTVLASPTLDTWYNLTMTADGTDIKYYLDGTLQSTVSQGSGSIPASSVELAIGNHVPSPVYAAWFDGNVGYYAVYDGAIGSTQIATNYSTNLPKFTPTPPPVYSGNVGGRQFGQGFNG